MPWGWLITIAALLMLMASVTRAADEFLPPEQAFRMEVRALDATTVEVAFRITDGYYLYREPFKFVAEGAKLGEAQVPAGKIKFDETFQKDVESYRGRVAIRLPVQQAPAAFTLKVTSQGCADAGLCYPPMTTLADVRLAAYGGDGSARVLGSADSLAGAGAIVGPTSAISVNSGNDAIDRAMLGGSGWVIVGVFFVAGLLLSFTPCVLPMLPILSSIVVGSGGGSASAAPSRSRGLMLAAVYSLGMALVYTALGVAAGLAGEGLAAALQKPWVLVSFALLLGLLALSMFGAYELQLPAPLRDRLNASSGRMQGGRFLGVFAMGGLSALIVSPCVAAPLAGALVYISQTRDVVLGGTALFSLAAGMSVPLLLVGASAGVMLPRAGAWMDRVKQLFGVLLLGVAWWIVGPLIAPALVVAGWGALLIGAACFLGAFDAAGATVGAGTRVAKACGLALAVAGAAQIVGAAAGADDGLRPLAPFTRSEQALAEAAAPSTTSRANAAADDPAPRSGASAVRFERIRTVEELNDRLRTAGRPVLLDFYADWCVSCKEMERYTFTDAAVRQRLAGTLLLQADVTRNNEADRALLKRFKLFGPPGIVFFDASGRELDGVRVIGYQSPDRFVQSLGRAGL